MQAVAQRMHVKQRQRQQKPVGGGDGPAGVQVERVGCEIVVREDGAFGNAGGAGGVDEGRGSIAVERDIGRAACCGTFNSLYPPQRRGSRHFLCGDHRLWLRIGEDVENLALAVEDVDGHKDHAELDAGEIDVDQFEAVGEIDA